MAERRERSSDNRDDPDFRITDVWTDHTQATTSKGSRRSPSREPERSSEGRSRSPSQERGRRRERRERTPEERRHRSYERSRSRSHDRGWRRYALDLERRLATTSLPRPSFSGTRKETLEFLREFEDYCAETHTPSSNKLGEVLKCLKGDARTWATASQDSWSTYEDFRHDFVEFYWPTHQRRAVAEEVRRGRFDPHRDGLMVDYFINKYGLLKSLMLPDSELDTIDSVMRVFPDDVWSAWSTIPSREKSFARAQEFLLGRGSGREHRDSDRGSPHRRRERRSPRRRRRDDSRSHAPVPALPAQAPFNPFSLPPPNTSGNARRTRW